VVEVTTRLCASLPRADLVREAQRRAILVVPVQGVMDIARDPHLRARGFFQTVPYPQLGMDLEVMRPPFISSGYRASARRAPMLGEHSGEVLSGLLGMDPGTIDVLSARGIVHQSAEVSAQ
jgi:crotonobetainyl-CoA:carnitine CoA-transferase CaiB-like acyl-CoA transferase